MTKNDEFVDRSIKNPLWADFLKTDIQNFF